jgi:hypothetical protein
MQKTLNVNNYISLHPAPYRGPNRAVFLSLRRIMVPLQNLFQFMDPLGTAHGNV